MKLPFDSRQFLEVFKNYNHSIWPLQLVFLLSAIISVYLVIWKPMITGKIIPFILALLWIWMGVVYHLLFFSKINEAANIFGLLFIVQGILFLRYGLTSQRFELKKDIYGITGSVLIIYALILYPLIGYYGGHQYPYSPTFGLPCPTTIFTFGMLVLSKQRVPFYMLIIPVIWALIGFSAVVKLGIYEDSGLLISAVLFTVVNLFKHKTLAHAHIP
jgi:Family of unknown function (DUF6064)